MDGCGYLLAFPLFETSCNLLKKFSKRPANVKQKPRLAGNSGKPGAYFIKHCND